MNDWEIAVQLKNGRNIYLERLINKYSNYLACIIKNIGRDLFTKEDIEEIIADVFILFWKNVNKFDFEYTAYSLKGYLSSIARNTAINELKRRKIEFIPLEEDLLYFDGDENDILIRKEMESAVKNSILEMEEPDKAIFMYYYYYGLKTHEIANILTMKQKTVESRLLRGRDRLKKILLERGIES